MFFIPQLQALRVKALEILSSKIGAVKTKVDNKLFAAQAAVYISNKTA